MILAWMLIGNLVVLTLLFKVDVPQPTNGETAAIVAFMQGVAIVWPVIAAGMLIDGVPASPAPQPQACSI